MPRSLLGCKQFAQLFRRTMTAIWPASRRTLQFALLFTSLLQFFSIAGGRHFEVAFLGSSFAATDGQQESPELPLLPGHLVQGELKGGERRLYNIELQPNQYVRFSADRHGADLVLSLFSPDGLKVLEVDSSETEENPLLLFWIAESPGTYILEVHASDSAKPVSYEAGIDALRWPTNRDRLLVAAEASFFEADKLHTEETRDSLQRASADYREALQIWGVMGYRVKRAIAYRYLGYAFRDLDEQEKALKYYQRALALYHFLSDRFGEAVTLTAIGRAYEELKDKKNALESYQQALSLLAGIDAKSRRANLLNRIGTIHFLQGENKEALDSYTEELSLRRAEMDQSEATTLSNIATVYLRAGDKRKALTFYNQALEIKKSLNNQRDAADLLKDISGIYYDLGDKQNALEDYQQEQQLREALNDSNGTAKAMVGAGKVWLAQGDASKARDLFNGALRLLEPADDHKEKADALRYLGLSYFLLKENEKAVEVFKQEFLLTKDENMQSLESFLKIIPSDSYDPELLERQKKLFSAPALTSVDMVHEWLSFGSLHRFSDDDLFHQAEAVFQTVGDLIGEGAVNGPRLLGLHLELTIAENHIKALLRQNEMLIEALREKGVQLPNQGSQDNAKNASTLQYWGQMYAKRDNQKALDNYLPALEMRRRIGDRKGEAETLMGLGDVWFSLYQNRKAISFYQQAGDIKGEEGDLPGQAQALRASGIVHNWMGERESALELYRQALDLQRKSQDRAGSAITFLHIGETYFLLGEKQKALENLNQALELSRNEKHPDGNSYALALIGLVYTSLNDKQKAREFYSKSVVEFQRGLTLSLVSFDLKQKASVYNALGDSYYILGQTQDALDAYRHVAIHDGFGSKSDHAYALNKLGLIHLSSGENEQALQSFKQALDLRRTDGNFTREAEAMHNLATAYEASADGEKALQFYNEALALRYRMKDPEGQGETEDRLMRLWKTLDRIPLAIFYGKQAINNFQQIRLNIQGLDKDIQNSFLTSRVDTYRDLADLLITAGRLPEAHQVLDLLKKEEYLEFIRRDGADEVAGAATLDSRETEAQRKFHEIQDRIAAAGQRYAALNLRGQSMSSDEKEESEKLAREIGTANEAFDQWMTALPAEFTGSVKDEVKLEVVRKEMEGFQETLGQLGSGTVALYTLVAKEKYHIFLVTPEVSILRTYTISAEDLNHKVDQFRRALGDLSHDPRPLARELYKVVVGPVEKDLEGAGAKTLMWSLDGTLRYLPLAALHDGEHYLVEKYRLDVFTPASLSRLEKQPASKWRGLGLGVSKGVDPLPFVPDELRGIIRDDTAPGSEEGVLSGKIFLDESFTRETLKEELRQGKGYPLVHIATHFRLKPGNEYDSYLLLGGQGKDSDESRHLTLAEIKSGTNIFRGVELLTLSACNTAVAKGGGGELENFATLAQIKGARAVIATLWPVEDRSTMQLMRTFYHLRNEHPDRPKLEALREAQLSLLRGAEEPPEASPAENGEKGDKQAVGESETHRFEPDPRAPYSHPYFWAPFILIGNWM